jgi:hypothetical protein
VKTEQSARPGRRGSCLLRYRLLVGERGRGDGGARRGMTTSANDLGGRGWEEESRARRSLILGRKAAG